MSNNFETNKLEEIKKFYEEAFRFYKNKKEIRWIDVRFYPYIGINHTIRLRDGIVFVRISDMCRELPILGQKALAYILVAKLLRKPVSTDAKRIYSKLTSAPDILEKASVSRKTRGKKVITSAKGATYDLDEIFDRINATYFQGTIAKPVLSWSARKTYHRLGHYSPEHHTIVISKSLDDPGVPDYVVDYLVFHEMLHIHHPTQRRNGRRYSHTRAFKQDEEKFRYFKQSDAWIEKNIGVLKRRAKGSSRPW